MERTPPTQIRPALSTRWRILLLLSSVALLSQAFRFPSPVRDAATLGWVSGYHLSFPIWHLLFTPFCSVADSLTVLGRRQDIVLLLWAVILCLWLGGWRRGPAYFLAFILFLAWGVLVPRPMARLMAPDPNILLIDFHSHTRVSHDGRRSFSPEANARWHRAQGFGAAYITDHNETAGAAEAKERSEADWAQTGYRSLMGEEVSLYETHLIVLGNRERIDNRPYDSDPKKIPVFVADMHKRGLPVIASLPEYWLHHWGAGVEDFARMGMDGFELVNSVPRAQDFPLDDRFKIVDLCRSQNLVVTGVSDNHGYGYATAAWNAMRIPGWRSMGPDALETAIVAALDSERYRAVQVLERNHFHDRGPVELLLSPLGLAVTYWRGLYPGQAVAWVVWILALGWLADRRRPSWR